MEVEIETLTKQAHRDRLSLSCAIAGNVELIRSLHGGNAPERIQGEIDAALSLNERLRVAETELAVLRDRLDGKEPHA
jgi:hypothetical protein